jgi:hypothetical protein
LKTKKIHEEKMPRKEELFLSKTQIQKLCELYHEEEHLWNIQSPYFHKKEKRNAALSRIKSRLEDEFENLPPLNQTVINCPTGLWYQC